MFHLIEFEEGNEIEIVPDVWIEAIEEGNGDGVTQVISAYPPRSERGSIRSLVKEGSTPKSTWESYKAILLYTNGKCYWYEYERIFNVLSPKHCESYQNSRELNLV